MYTPSADPVPWVTEALTRAGTFDTTSEELFDYKTSKYATKERVSNIAAAALLDVLTNTVAALHDDAKAYRVVLNKRAASAGTLLERRIVEVGSKPMNDDDLTDGQKASVMMGLALHEVGHIRYSRQYAGAVTRLFGAGKVTSAINVLSNLAADCHDEAEAMEDFQGLAPTIAVTLWWVGGKGELVPRVMDLDESVQHRVNAAIAATRYPWQVDWDATPNGQAWVDWWVDWAKRARRAGQPKLHAVIVKEAIEKVRDFTPTPTEPEPEQPEPPQSDPGEPGEPEQDGQSQPDMSDGPGDEPEKPQDGPQQPQTTPEGEDEGEGTDGDDDGSEPAESGQGDATDRPPEDTDHEASESGDEAGNITTNQGGLGHEDLMDDYTDRLDENKPMDGTCVKSAAVDPKNDYALQQGAEYVTRGKREGMRSRTYHHSTSGWGKRVVVSIPRKGKRWVYDV